MISLKACHRNVAGFLYFCPMELNFESLELILRTEITIFGQLGDKLLFEAIQPDLIDCINNLDTTFVYFGLAPDNDADGQEELLEHGTFYRIIAPDHLLGIDTDATPKEIKKAFLDVLDLNLDYWCTLFVEEAGEKKQTTIEILFKV